MAPINSAFQVSRRFIRISRPRRLYEQSLKRGEAQIVADGALCAETGHHTGRSPKDKHTVVDELTEKKVWWDNNKKVSKEHFNNLLEDFLAHAKGNELFAQDLYGGAHKNYRIKVRVFTELAWHSLFIRTLLIRPRRKNLRASSPNSPFSISRRSSRTRSVTAAAKAPTRWSRSTSRAKSF